MKDKRDDIIRKLKEMNKEIAEPIIQKNAVERFTRYSGELSGFLSSGFKVVTGLTFDEMTQQLLQIVKHAESLWDESMLLFNIGRYSTACFLSIVCIEECAKINFGMFQVLVSATSKTSSSNQRASTVSRKRGPLTSHTMKHFLAACSGALVNSRMDRILGMDKVASFISDCETGRIEELRQRCLYTDIAQSGNKVILPMEQISGEQALFYVCLAGEILAEAGGIEPSTWEKLLEKVDKFEKEKNVKPSK